MAKPQNPDEPRRANLADDWPHLVTFGSRFFAVAAVVLIAAVLRSEPPTAAPALATDLAETPPVVEVPEPLLDEAPPPAVEIPEPVEPAASAATDSLVDRAGSDLARLSGAGNRWTAQLALLCDADRARDVLERFGAHDALYVLPAMHGNAACFRIAWGLYTSRELAARAADLPTGLRSIQPQPLARPLSEVLE